VADGAVWVLHLVFISKLEIGILINALDVVRF
jgi:hypothetical protein